MLVRPLFVKFLAFLVAFAPMRPLAADPCGMVPPIQSLAGAIQRTGVQQTYVFHRGGIETLVLRPAFTGSVEEFGMLIPFPSPPSVRKVADNVFEHIAAAIDPPEVVVNLMPMPETASADAFYLGGSTRRGLVLRDEVRVLSQEAVGMYEVAVLEAGSARALKTWMTEHGYRYPDGMDKVCDDYVADRWCFVAVKTRVGSKTAAAPRPGMRRADAQRPAGSSFQGAVQAMGFRFRSDELVVPMRLSTFNSGKDERNVVYLLSERASAIRNLPTAFVKRQVPGWKLLQNVTQPLPVRIIGGTIDQLPPERLKALAQQQDPKPRNGIAKELFLGDLEAARLGALVHGFEEREKRLLNIGEELGLRGSEIDAQIANVLASDRAAQQERVLRDLAGMTMTVIDGAFSREVLARENLKFVDFAMAGDANHAGRYDAKVMGPAQRRGGVVALGPQLPRNPTWPSVLFATLAAAIVAGGIAWARRRPRLLATGCAIALLTFGGSTVAAQDPAYGDLLVALEQPARAADAVRELVARGRRTVPGLLHVAKGHEDLEARGWALVALGRIGGEGVDGSLAVLHDDARLPELVRTWAAAARIAAARDIDEVLARNALVQRFPAVKRPFGKRLAALLNTTEGVDRLGDVLAVASRDSSLQRVLAPAIVGVGAGALMHCVACDPDNAARRTAAGFLATLALDDYRAAAEAVVEQYRFDVEATRAPWHGGALFLPAVLWKPDAARAVAGALVRWHLWSDRRGDAETQKQIHNNLRSLRLAKAAGYQSPGWREADTPTWLRAWGSVVGADGVHALLEEQGVADSARYRAVVEALRNQ